MEQREVKDVEFKTVSAKEVKFGKNNFIEIARKQCITKTGENNTEFIAMSRGFFLPDGTRRYKKSIAIPDDIAIKDFIVKTVKAV